jgi:hypothetical protein
MEEELMLDLDLNLYIAHWGLNWDIEEHKIQTQR